MVKTFFKLLLSVIVYTVVFMIANAFMPFSQGFRELNASGNPMSLLFLLIDGVWISGDLTRLTLKVRLVD